ncbi:hypothetical protein [Chitinophaga eiseniae]|uniref:Uncharacterized protein n=1 Tax=Chitinophaga eiseniae TaxID=634771 RepID=A0A847SW05_9BACT|nr:hypothetical protein [Chitinophaga eiseniae]NLR82259.1 hypothetical protein [Chitinophaga eiseniae]
MPIVEEKYDQSRIDSLRRSLQREADKGKPRDYEIIVDGFKVVPRTNVLDEFDDYEQEIRDTTRNVSFLLYDGPATNRNTRYSFSMQQGKAHQPEQAATLGEIDQIVAQKLTERERDYELARLREQLQQSQGQLQESEEYAEQLQERITQLEAEQKGKMLKLGDLGASVLMGILRNNAKNLPGGEALAGLLGASDATAGTEPPTQEGAASYSRTETIDEQTRGRIALLQQMQERLDEPQLIGVLTVVEHLCEHPQHIATVVELLQTKQAA